MKRQPTPADLRWVRAFRRRVAAQTDELCGLVAEELGKPEFETLTSELVPLLTACRWHERHARRWLRPRKLRGRSVWQLGQSHTLHREPWGEVAIIATWNYPLQLLGVQLVQAVVAGNAVTVKPSERSPRSQQRLIELAWEAGLSRDRLRQTSAEREAGERLLAERQLDYVVFTGSTAVGRRIAERLATTLTPSALELSGADSALVLEDGDPLLAADGIAFAATLNGGATCMAPRRVIVAERHRQLFENRLGNHLGYDAEVPPYPEADRQGARACAAAAVAAGGRWQEPAAAGESWPGVRVVLDCPADTALARGEHFGPALAVMFEPDDTAVLRRHAEFKHRLATAVYTAGPRHRLTELTKLGGGLVTVNDAVLPSAHPAAPLAGHGPSGWGVTCGGEGLRAMTRPVVVSRTRRWPRTPLDLPSEAVQKKMAGFVRWWYG
jgi:aldehyde dehydrogenase (NAD+)